MKQICGIGTIKCSIALGIVMPFVWGLYRLTMVIADAESSDLTTRDIALTIGTPVSGLVFLMIFIKMLRHCLVCNIPHGLTDYKLWT